MVPPRIACAGPDGRPKADASTRASTRNNNTIASSKRARRISQRIAPLASARPARPPPEFPQQTFQLFQTREVGIRLAQLAVGTLGPG